MGRKIKIVNLWLRRKVNIPLLLVSGLVIILLFINEETSMKLNVEYAREINQLKEEIKLNRDSAIYYEEKYRSLLTGNEELEKVAREQYNMQRPSEDVYVIKEK